MAYSKLYYYRSVIKVQAIVLEKQPLGIPLIRIYKDYIEHKFDISYSTFSNYLSVPQPKAKLKKLEAKNNPKK